MPLRDMDREQMWLLPPSLDELLPQDHPARFVAEIVDALNKEDWSELGVDIDGDSMGAPAYHPRALLSVWLYGFMTGVRSCTGVAPQFTPKPSHRLLRQAQFSLTRPTFSPPLTPTKLDKIKNSHD